MSKFMGEYGTLNALGLPYHPFPLSLSQGRTVRDEDSFGCSADSKGVGGITLTVIAQACLVGV
ncbi:MAG TPA: hypothetical protein VJ734_04695, partial [Nitrosospira sp.]|nr:hypothetical protein [Nitrosospira sp.]